jgi:hypothetical protein
MADIPADKVVIETLLPSWRGEPASAACSEIIIAGWRPVGKPYPPMPAASNTTVLKPA